MDEAVGLYERALQQAPHEADALYLLGAAKLQLGAVEASLSLTSQAVTLNPHFFASQAIRAKALLQLGRLDEAAAGFRRSIELNPQVADSHLGLGVALNLAGRHKEAVQCLDKALALKPDEADGYMHRGAARQALDQLSLARADLERAVTLNPGLAAGHVNLGNLLRALDQLDGSLQSYDRALKLQPDLAEAYSNRASVLRDMERLDEAEASARKAIALRADFADAYYNLGGVLEDLDRLPEAAEAFSKAIALRATFPQALYSKAVVLQALLRTDEAIDLYTQAMALQPDYGEARWNRSLALLARGDLKTGWAEYESRWTLNPKYRVVTPREFGRPKWNGRQSLKGQTILLHAEQGLGDTIQFCRYATLVKALGAERVILEAQPELVTLLQGLEGVDLVIRQMASPPAFDLHFPLMSLPAAFGTTTDSIPSSPAYLHAPADKAQTWAQRLGSKTRPRVGIVWSGGLTANWPAVAKVQKRRNMPLAALAPLNTPCVEFFSLQKGPPAAELASEAERDWSGPAIVDLTGDIHDFSDTAALVEQLDLVIAVDTSTAHLAGAMGKPVWLLNRYDSCWRWLRDRADTPWYPTMRLIRQSRPYDWDSVVAEAVEALRAFAPA